MEVICCNKTFIKVRFYCKKDGCDEGCCIKLPDKCDYLGIRIEGAEDDSNTKTFF